MKTAIELITEERQRQIEKEGYSSEHDLLHDGGELAIAAACYAAHPMTIYRFDEYARSLQFKKVIPFDEYEIDDKHSELRRLIIAGALIVAEIERLQNQSSTPQQ